MHPSLRARVWSYDLFPAKIHDFRLQAPNVARAYSADLQTDSALYTQVCDTDR